MKSILLVVPIVYLALVVHPYVLIAIPLVLIAGVLLERQIRGPLQIHHCPTCRYDLRATKAANCPECGAKIIISSSEREDTASREQTDR